MTELNDHELLAEFARSGSEVAFATLTARHVNLVYSAALRFCGDAQHCEEITQAVFIILARKAGKLSPRVVLSGWLYQTARLTAANLVKGEIRRQRREQEAYMQSTLNETTAAAWAQLAPLLDEAMGRLGETDRNAVVLRFFENKTAAEVAAALKLTEAAAHKRVNRALEKLRKIFSKRGVALSATIIAGAVAANSAQAAPAGLAATVTAAAAKGVSISATLTTLVKTTMKTMTWLKIKFAIGVGVTALLAGGVATVAVSQASKSDFGLTPQQIARQSQEAYAALTSYSDNGATISTIGPTSVTNTFHIRLQRPDFYRIDWSQLIAPGVTYSKGVVWSAGDGHFMQMSSSSGDVYPQPKSAGRQQNLGAAAGVSSFASSTIPGAFFGEQTVGEQTGNASLRLVLMGATKLTQEPDAIVGGVDCHVFTSKHDSSKMPGGGKQPNNMGSTGQATTTFWIGKKDHLIRQTRMVMDTSHMTMPTMSDEQIKNILGKTGKPVTIEAVAFMHKTMEDAQRQLSLGNITFLETHENIVVNQKFSPADFAR
jgi:RNA polymerase sigma factor (sigma-70 family)